MGKFKPPGNRRLALINAGVAPLGHQGIAVCRPAHGAKVMVRLGLLRERTIMGVDRILIARILLTLVSLGYGLATVFADFNKTHATNPQWTPHARFHVVWQISSYVGFGLMALVLLWWPGPYAMERLILVALMAAIVYAAFFVAVFTMPVYGGAAYDSNGYQPFAAPLPIIAKRWDVNITAFSVQLVLLAAGVLALVGAAAS
jgi:hypothetical protein